ncbi:hypothetical protein [Paenibacillus sp. SI8]|uniref:hypothetical protein n=1 Tax=unclassified Paenibacillus TaxID=185978 RepID=UPI0034653918
MAQLIVAGNATAAQVLTGSTFSAGPLSGTPGTMPNQGAVTITPSASNQAIPAGYHNGSGSVPAVVVPAANVLVGTTIAGTAGTMPNRGAPTFTPTTYDQGISAGYFSGGIVKGDANLIPSKIPSGVTIFGVNGTASDGLIKSVMATDARASTGILSAGSSFYQRFYFPAGLNVVMLSISTDYHDPAVSYSFWTNWSSQLGIAATQAGSGSNLIYLVNAVNTAEGWWELRIRNDAGQNSSTTDWYRTKVYYV